MFSRGSVPSTPLVPKLVPDVSSANCCGPVNTPMILRLPVAKTPGLFFEKEAAEILTAGLGGELKLQIVDWISSP